MSPWSNLFHYWANNKDHNDDEWKPESQSKTQTQCKCIIIIQRSGLTLSRCYDWCRTGLIAIQPPVHVPLASQRKQLGGILQIWSIVRQLLLMERKVSCSHLCFFQDGPRLRHIRWEIGCIESFYPALKKCDQCCSAWWRLNMGSLTVAVRGLIWPPIQLWIRIEKHLQCEKLLGLAGGSPKKRGNKKSGESRTPIRYNVIHMYIFAKAVFHAIWFSKVNPVTLVVG